ncbi:ferrous iron transport protein B [Neptunitalea chrysea]|uniref:Ferrous iron transport protein B n=1 Tax=Neptunitalea chrysea TaxID=1647581 RepID=A0A9W6B408_9FLAO|nr:ferrous iron transport protein B [Neptunitalea chrysea]GLB51392.1 ferrous iron transport protein B [Neptunitalea chrysea]
MSKQIKVALIGNPNTGKTSVFNALTGLNQKVGNYPGITVEKKEGICKLPRGIKAHILDLPGTYSLNATSLDENVVIELLLNKNDKDFPDVAVIVADVENLKRNLLLYTQIKDLEIPTILVVNMADRMERHGISLDIELLEAQLKTKIALVSSRKGTNIEHLKDLILNYKNLSTEPCVNASVIDQEYFDGLKKAFPNQSIYKLWLVITQDVNFVKLDRNLVKDTSSFSTKSRSDLKRMQQKETIVRYQFINNVLKETFKKDINAAKDLRSVLDRILMHKVYGFATFFFILLLIFQAIYSWSEVPTNLIENTFSFLAEWIKETLPSGAFTNLIAEGIIPGIGGIVIFIPQIAFLFLFISILEETGYMSRVVFLMDKIMRRFGLSGKSVVPLISGTACAIPAIMATRNIENWKERLITILVTPFTTCSARLPVYLIIISMVIPQGTILGLSYQALALMSLYILGFIMAVASAYILNKILRTKTRSFFVVEMPNYKIPLFKNIAITVFEKTKSFVLGAGKIILSLSIILWFLATNGPTDKFTNAEKIITEKYKDQNISKEELNKHTGAYQLENSYIGICGKTIEPIIRPLGYDWKIGIAIVSSFAAREVFVGTLATIYSVESDDENTIKNRMKSELMPDGTKVFNLASGISLLLFYAFAMQCMSTLAIVKKETNSWKWPSIQLISMTGFAYVVAFIAFQILK